jgi:hypothetical protein
MELAFVASVQEAGGAQVKFTDRDGINTRGNVGDPSAILDSWGGGVSKRLLRALAAGPALPPYPFAPSPWPHQHQQQHQQHQQHQQQRGTARTRRQRALQPTGSDDTTGSATSTTMDTDTESSTSSSLELAPGAVDPLGLGPPASQGLAITLNAAVQDTAAALSALQSTPGEDVVGDLTDAMLQALAQSKGWPFPGNLSAALAPGSVKAISLTRRRSWWEYFQGLWAAALALPMWAIAILAVAGCGCVALPPLLLWRCMRLRAARVAAMDKDFLEKATSSTTASSAAAAAASKLAEAGGRGGEESEEATAPASPRRRRKKGAESAGSKGGGYFSPSAHSSSSSSSRVRPSSPPFVLTTTTTTRGVDDGPTTSAATSSARSGRSRSHFTTASSSGSSGAIPHAGDEAYAREQSQLALLRAHRRQRQQSLREQQRQSSTSSYSSDNATLDPALTLEGDVLHSHFGGSRTSAATGRAQQGRKGEQEEEEEEEDEEGEVTTVRRAHESGEEEGEEGHRLHRHNTLQQQGALLAGSRGGEGMRPGLRGSALRAGGRAALSGGRGGGVHAAPTGRSALHPPRRVAAWEAAEAGSPPELHEEDAVRIAARAAQVKAETLRGAAASTLKSKPRVVGALSQLNKSSGARR